MGNGNEPELGFVVRDLQRSLTRVAANLRWYEQTWLGVPIWQLPDDLVALQRILFDANPRWVVETGTKFGGSALFFASLLAMMGRDPGTGGVITVDVEETAVARALLGSDPATRHRFAPFVHRILGDAKAPESLAAIRTAIAADPGPVMVLLDDWHDAEHVHAELEAYSELVSPGGYLIVADTTFEDLADTPLVANSAKYRNAATSNPRAALRRFLANRKDFEVIPDYTSTGISNFPDSVLKKTGRS